MTPHTTHQSEHMVVDQASRLRQLVGGMRAATRPKSADPSAPRPAPIIAVASGKGGVGKTTTCVNLSISLARQNRRICLLDADLGCANADVVCGMMPQSRLGDEAKQGGSIGLSDLIVEAPGGFGLIPGSVGIGHAGELDEHGRARLVAHLDELRVGHDALLIDTSAGLGDAVTGFLRAADFGVVVMTPEPTSVADAYALIKVLVTRSGEEGAGTASRTGLVINQVGGRREAERVYRRMAGVCDRFLGIEVPMLGYIRSDKRVGRAVKARSPYMLGPTKGAAARDMMRLSRSLIVWAGIEPGGDGLRG